MLNHARTLLLNAKPSNDFGVYPGEEYIPPGYTPVVLPSYLQRIRAELFGTAPDRMLLNYRGRQLLQMIHGTELEEFLLELDPRVTYSATDDSLFRHPYGLGARQYDGSATRLYLQGNFGQDPAVTGISRRRWRVEVFSELVYVTALTAQREQTVTSVTAADDLAGPISLPGTDLSFYFREATPGDTVSAYNFLSETQFGGTAGYDKSGLTAAMSWSAFTDADWAAFTGDDWSRFIGDGDYVSESIADAKWLFQLDTRPRRDLGAVSAALARVGDETDYDLFGVASGLSRSEPFKTFRALWHEHAQLPYKLGGLVLAYIYQTERVRLGS